jgi:purine-cytosine permease-like protein
MLPRHWHQLRLFRHRSATSWLIALPTHRASGGLNLGIFSTGLIGPLYYGLSFADTTAIVWTGAAIGSAISAYMATFGKRHGLRALANSRYSMGWWPNMAMAALNVVTECAFGVVACLQGGQALNTISNQNMPLAVGILIIGVVSWLIATMGFTYIQWYQR